jgi:hypothetical protein
MEVGIEFGLGKAAGGGEPDVVAGLVSNGGEVGRGSGWTGTQTHSTSTKFVCGSQFHLLDAAFWQTQRDDKIL